MLMGAGFVLVSAVVLLVADRLMTTKANMEQEQLFAERLNSIITLLERKQELLTKTGMEDAYRRGFQESAVKELAEKYYSAGTVDSYPLILDAKGKVIMHPRLAAGDESVVSLPVVQEKILTSNEGASDYEYLGEMKWCMFRTFEPWEWKVIYTIPLRSKYQAVAQFRTTFLVTMGAMSLGVLAAMFGLISLATRPIRHLTLVASRMAAGDLDQEVDITRGDEIGTLARSFAEMRDAIRTKIHNLDLEIAERERAQEELAELNRTLEHRVEQRTEELTGANERLQDQIQQREKAEEAARKAREVAEGANQAKSEFLANMSHEIRTPLTAILGFADLMKEPNLSPSDRLNWLSTIQRNGEHLLALINDILDLSKVEAGKITLTADRCKPVALVADVVSMMRIRAQQRGLALLVRYDGLLPETILSDEKRLRQVLVNLVGNAVKFTETGSVIVATTFLPKWRGGEPAVRLAVVDSGIGIAPEDVARLCEPFYQADGSATRKGGGTGLGLAISRRIVELMGGELTIESEIGRGSVFAITVPTGSLEGVQMLDQPAEAVLAAGPVDATGAPRAAARLDGLRILVAEDGLDNQRLIRVVLTKAGAEVEVAENGRIAMERVEAKPPDIILMDMQMPEMDGYQATRLLREKGVDIPIVALTAHALTEDRELCLSAGCTDYMSKPIDRRQLVETVAKLTGGRTSAVADADGGKASETPAVQGAITSEYADDSDLAEVIDEFIAGLGDQVVAMRQALANGHFEEFRRLSHQLKGAGGSYGFPCLTDVAKKLEELAKAADTEGSTLAMTELEGLCQAIMCGQTSTHKQEVES